MAFNQKLAFDLVQKSLLPSVFLRWNMFFLNMSSISICLLFQTEIAKRLNTICNQLLPFLSQEVSHLIYHFIFKEFKSPFSSKGISLIKEIKVYNLESILMHVAADIYLFRVNNRNSRTRCEICSKLTMKTPERGHWRLSDVCIGNFEHISHLNLVFYC